MARTKLQIQAGTCKAELHLWIDGQRCCVKCKNDRNRGYMKERRQDPEFREDMLRRDRERNHKRRQDPEFRESELQWQLKYNHERYQNNIQVHLSEVLRNRVRSAVKNNQKAGSAVSDLGIGIPEFKLYLENQFEDRMTWENWGNGNGKWNIDHVIPLSSFDLTDRTQFLEACNWLNMQPMWWKDNLRKGNR